MSQIIREQRRRIGRNRQTAFVCVLFIFFSFLINIQLPINGFAEETGISPVSPLSTTEQNNIQTTEVKAKSKAEPKADSKAESKAKENVGSVSNTRLKNEEELDAQQRNVYDQWRKLEEVLLRMAEMAGDSDPDRAELLRRVVSLGKQKLVDNQFKSLIDLLEEGKLSRALDQQKGLRTDLTDLLKVLETENRMKKVLSEKERLKAYLKELEGIIAGQKSLQNRTMDSSSPQHLSEEQKNLADQAEQLKERIKADESPEGQNSAENQKSSETNKADNNQKNKTELQSGEPQSGESQSKESQSGESQSGESQSGESQSKEAQSGESQSKEAQSGESQSGESQSGEAQSGESQSGESQSKEAQSGEPQSKDKRLEKAKKRMQEAQKQLEKSQKEKAVEKQEEALRELEQAKKDLEEILRQLREEEQKRTLTQLEARFRKMYQKQKLIYDSTTRLAEMAATEGNGASVRATVSQESARLGSQEGDIFLEGQKAILLLRQDGTAAAMTEVLESACEQMQSVSELFARQDVSKLNQTQQENILSTLEELIESVNRQLKENEAKQNQSGNSSGGMQQEEGLVDKLAELRIIRSQQLRINRSTKIYSEMRKSGEKRTDVTDPTEPVLSDSLKKAVDELARRQGRLKEILYDMSLGRNQ